MSTVVLTNINGIYLTGVFQVLYICWVCFIGGGKIFFSQKTEGGNNIMCLIVRGNRFAPVISRKDRVVYKVFYARPNGVLRAAYRDYKYKPGGTYDLGGDSLVSEYDEGADCYSVERGFHACTSLQGAILVLKRISYFEFLHPVACGASDLVIHQCVIPAGAEYFLGTESEIVSNRIVIGDRVTK